jgi:ABC-type multidrug transport system ATPase subunit
MSLDFTSLTFTNVSRHFGRRRALHRVSFELHARTITALLGPNGAGKSTILSIAATLLHPSTGDVRYGTRGAAAHGLALRASIGLLAHDLYLYPELTPRENLRFFARLYGLDRETGRIDVALSRAGLEARADDLVGGFSRGMRQRLALERALIHDPRLLLLDEPFTGLDASSRNALRTRLDEARAAGAIVLLTTHDLAAVAGLTDATLTIEDGRLAA